MLSGGFAGETSSSQEIDDESLNTINLGQVVVGYGSKFTRYLEYEQRSRHLLADCSNGYTSETLEKGIGYKETA